MSTGKFKQIRDLYVAGNSLAAIGRILGVSRQRVHQILQDNGTSATELRRFRRNPAPELKPGRKQCSHCGSYMTFNRGDKISCNACGKWSLKKNRSNNND